LGVFFSTLLGKDEGKEMQDAAQRCRVVVTGMGAVTPLGLSVEAFWRNLVAGVSGIGPMALCDPSAYPCRISGELPSFDPGQFMQAKEARRMARFTQLAVAAAQMAVEDAHLDLDRTDRTRVGVILGNGSGGFPTIDETMRTVVEKGGMRISPFFFPMILTNMASATVSRILGAKGVSSTIGTACAASTQSIGDAAELIRRRAADVVFTGGTEAGISELGLAGFCVMRALSSRNEDPQAASRPFDARRDGFVPAEGAAILVLESLEHALSRGANILAEVAGYGATSDAYHPVQPEESGEGAARAMRLALEDAGVSPAEVDYINAHGTSTPLNDVSETRAIKLAFGDQAYRVPISSTKSMIGHALGAAGGMEAVACVKTILDGVIHPTMNYQYPDPACDLDYVPNQARVRDVRVVLSNSFGFGGQNACLVFRKFEG
jgi:3-oxoacyl-[acyl-carrier-protein] synthase II